MTELSFEVMSKEVETLLAAKTAKREDKVDDGIESAEEKEEPKRYYNNIKINWEYFSKKKKNIFSQ